MNFESYFVNLIIKDNIHSKILKLCEKTSNEKIRVFNLFTFILLLHVYFFAKNYSVSLIMHISTMYCFGKLTYESKLNEFVDALCLLVRVYLLHFF